MLAELNRRVNLHLYKLHRVVQEVLEVLEVLEIPGRDNSITLPILKLGFAEIGNFLQVIPMGE